MTNYKINKVEQINLEVFGGCNLACPMCPQGLEEGREKEFKKSMNEDLFKSIIDQAIPLGLKFVNLSGSGEPLLNKNFEKYCSYLRDRGIVSMINTNGKLLTKEKFEKLCDAGLTILKVSCMGWDRDSYAHYMSVDNYDNMRSTLLECLKILKQKKYNTTLQTNHLIQDYDKKDYQLQKYLENWINYLNIQGEIWLVHNWSGVYNDEATLAGGKSQGDINHSRHEKYKKRNRRSCGRPLANVIEIRAGGIGKKRGAIVPCPNVLGQDSKAVLGHLEDNSLLEVINGKEYTDLRQKHINKEFDEIDYCRDCDHLIDVPESLVWTNIDKRKYGGSRVSFIDYVGSIKNFEKK